MAPCAVQGEKICDLGPGLDNLGRIHLAPGLVVMHPHFSDPVGHRIQQQILRDRGVENDTHHVGHAHNSRRGQRLRYQNGSLDPNYRRSLARRLIFYFHCGDGRHGRKA